MTSKNKIEKWLFADWSTGNNSSVAGDETKAKSVHSNEVNVIQDELPLMEKQLRLTKVAEHEVIEDNVAREGRDYSPSGSSWAPSGQESSSDGSDDENESKTEQYIRHYAKRRTGKNVPVPVHRPNAVVNVLKERQNNIDNKTNQQNRKRKHKETRSSIKSLPDSTKKHLQPKNCVNTININKKSVLEMKASFDELFKIIDNMKPKSARQRSQYFGNTTAQQVSLNEETKLIPLGNTEAYEECGKSESEESNRSDDNVLISNKHTVVAISEAQTQQKSYTQQNATSDDANVWVAIGSGKTLIHKDKFNKVNWRSYTIATRTLLLATFPRRILATHSLTGKRSPAFQDKPAKMCLDPKIVSDIIIEITSKFNVKENLVRNAITTKCADECKMLKTRQKNKSINNQENASPVNVKLERNRVKPEQRNLSQEC